MSKGHPMPVIATCIRTGERYHFSSTQAAADEGGFSQSCVSRCIRGSQRVHAGHTFHTTRPLKESRTKERRAQINALAAKGLNQQQIARELGVSPSTVNYHRMATEQ